MYTAPEGRNNGFGTKVLEELEAWAIELGYQSAILETSKSMQDAVHLYQKNGYLVIPNYDQYIGVETSHLFSKKLGKN
ncbi:MAG: GNAT family N-acetyltransferase [Saprospiraceae bacterium]|nr:GNAT family N-acetyltransferase [Saprospiraceae bacterium]